MAAIQVTGYRQLLRDLDQITPGLRKETMKEISAAAGDVRDLARRYAPDTSPMSGWSWGAYRANESKWADRAYGVNEVRAGIRTQRGQSRPDRSGYRNEIGIENRSPAGMIYELAGSKSRGEGTGVKFIENIAATGLQVPLRRLVLRAVIELQPQTRARIQKALEHAQARFNARQAVTR